MFVQIASDAYNDLTAEADMLEHGTVAIDQEGEPFS